MKVTSLSFFILLFSFIVKAQGHFEGTKEISTFEEAETYAESFPEVFLAFLFEDSGSEAYLQGRLNWRTGDVYDDGYYSARIVSSEKNRVYRFNFLSFTNDVNRESFNLSEQALAELKSGISFEEVTKKYSQSETETNPDVGWTYIEYFIEDFKKTIENAHLGDQFVWHDTILGRHNLVEITHTSKEVEGHYVLFFPREVNSNYRKKVNHHKNIRKLKTKDGLGWYAAQHLDEVSLNLVDEGLNPELFDLVNSELKKTKKGKAVLVNDESYYYRLVSDTSIDLYSLQYIYINGEVVPKEELESRVTKIKEKYNSGISFDDLVEEYWKDHGGFSKMIDVDGALLVEDLVVKMKGGNVGDLFVAQEGDSYFVGLKLAEPQTVKAFLLLTYPMN